MGGRTLFLVLDGNVFLTQVRLVRRYYINEWGCWPEGGLMGGVFRRINDRFTTIYGGNKPICFPPELPPGVKKFVNFNGRFEGEFDTELSNM